MDIKEIALRVAQAINLHYIVTGEMHTNDDWNIRFATALIAELAKQNEPVTWCVGYDDPRMGRIHSNPTMCKPEAEALVKSTTSELIVCSLYALPPTASQIEQETAEAIAKMLDDAEVEETHYCMNIYEEGKKFQFDMVEAIRSGAWKEFKK